jgi:very-short-patch-repair endonuclease
MVDEIDMAGSIDAAIAEIAGRQHGVVTSSQLQGFGLSREAIAKRTRGGRLHRVHRGVHSVGHEPLSQAAWWMAAVLACGEGAVLSHASAAVLWGLLRPLDGPIHISVPTDNGRMERRGIRLHRCPSLAAAVAGTNASDDRTATTPRLTTVRNRIPVTTVPRTLEDLPGSVPDYLHRRAVRQAELAGYSLPAIESDRTRSDLERDFLRFCRRHDIPAPEVNVRIGRLTVDFLWRTERLVVETDGYAYHQGSVSFEDDHRRDLHLRRAGYTVHRYTGAQLRNHPAEVVAELGEVLGGPTGEATSVGAR